MLLFVVMLQLACVSNKNAIKYQKSSSKAGKPIMTTSFDAELLAFMVEERINEKRVSKERNVLQADPVLWRAADDHNNYMLTKGKLTHDQKSSDKKAVIDRVLFYNGEFEIVGENIQFMGFNVMTSKNKKTILLPTYEEAANNIAKNWIKSKGHYENLIKEEFEYVGTGISLDLEQNGIYATQVFGTK
ncbi:MAG: CAP domain-containing protein [Chitinophagales bacterium]